MVTGAAHRVGRAIALRLAERGCDLVLTWHRTPIDATEAQVRALGARVTSHRCDLADDQQLAQLIETVRAQHDVLDVLVHNASTYAPSPLGPGLADAANGNWRANALAPLLLSSELAPLLSRSQLPGKGCVVAMLDVHALGWPAGSPRLGHIAYAMSKAALAEMVRSLALELAPSMRVNGVAPGVVAWPTAGPEADPAMQRRYLASVPLGRAGTEHDAADAVAYLALDAAYVTGQVLVVDGGRSLR